jgi:hypothetical protein
MRLQYSSHATSVLKPCDSVVKLCDFSTQAMRLQYSSYATSVLKPCDFSTQATRLQYSSHATSVLKPCDFSTQATRLQYSSHATSVFKPCDFSVHRHERRGAVTCRWPSLSWSPVEGLPCSVGIVCPVLWRPALPMIRNSRNLRNRVPCVVVAEGPEA